MMGMNGTNGIEVEAMQGQAGGKVVYGDGSWQLTVFVTDLQVERNLRVRGDLHIGGVMIKLVDSLGKQTYRPTRSISQQVLWMTVDQFD